MNFIKKIGDSVYSPAFYSSLNGKPLSFSIKYFFGLILIIALLGGTVTSVLIVPELKVFLSSLGREVISHYPDGLKIEIKKGQASINKPEPYVVKMPTDSDSLGELARKHPDIENLLVVDTKTDFSLTEFNNYKTVVLLARDVMVYKDKDDKITIQSLKKMPDITFTREIISGWIEKLTPLIKSLTFIIPPLLFIAFFILCIFQLVYCLIAGLLVWIIAKIKKLNFSYQKSYQISIHLATLGMILGITGLNVLHFSPIPFTPTILIVILAFVNLKQSEDILIVS